MTGFFAELKRRKVYRVAIAYAVASWALAQGLAQVLPVFDVPNSLIRGVIALLLIGFPVALIFAWTFDITPSGIERTVEAQPQPGARGQRQRSLILLGGMGVIIAAAAGLFLLPRAAAHKVDKSIAVLPFENLSDDKENAYFADGIQDDILTNLSKIGDLKVISRTSVMGYRGRTGNAREIGKALGVANILEGSVRRAGNNVRVNAQLIDATSDKHIWAEDYDGDLTDVFKIQTDLAHQIAAALQAKLSPSEKEHIERKPTGNGEAYLAFIRAHDLWSSAVEDLAKLKFSEQTYQRAVDLDPNFALAYARYAQLESWIVHTFDSSPERKAKARALAQRAIELQPQLPEAHLGLGFVHYYVDNDFGAAAREFEIAQRGLPNESEVYLALGAIQRRQGKWTESNASLERAVSLNPKDVWTLQNLAINYEMQRNFEAANKIVDRALAIDPNALGSLELKGKIAIEENGDLNTPEQILARIESIPKTPEVEAKLAEIRITVFLFQRKFQEAALAAENFPDANLTTFPGALCSKYTALGMAKKALQDDVGARQVFAKARAFAQAEIAQNPDSAVSHARFAEVLAWLGEKEAALAEIERAQQLLPPSKDAFEGPEIVAKAAEIHAIFGNAAAAVPILDDLLQRPSSVTLGMLKVNPVWDPIRSDPQFQRLLDKYSGKA
jgi:TolB-like protein/cytochrome c-type biogenesis protein CcmH/NrfG